MKNANVNSSKKENAKSSNVKSPLLRDQIKEEKKSEIVAINLSQFADQLSSMEIKEKKIRETIYIYPESISKSDINGEKGKKFRNGIRNQKKRFCNNILIFAKTNRLDDLKKEIDLFDAFYKGFFRINDYSLASISQSNDPLKERDLNLMIQIIKECKK